MKNINELQPQNAIIFNNEEEEIKLIQNETKVRIITDNTDFDEYYEGLITFITVDGLEVEESEFIKWEYILEIDVI